MVLKNRTNGKQDVGLALLGVGSAFGVWSSLNTSPTGIVQFAVNQPDIAYKGMNLSVLILLAMGIGIGMYYKERGYLAAFTTAGTGVAMWLWYDKLLKENVIPNPVANV